VLRSNRGASDINIAGNSNKLDIEQLDAAGANGHLLKQVIVGDYNYIVTQQQGTNDTTLDLKTTGDHNTITIRTSSTSITSPKTAAAR
jgi:phage tail sheath gpL-like